MWWAGDSSRVVPCLRPYLAGYSLQSLPHSCSMKTDEWQNFQAFVNEAVLRDHRQRGKYLFSSNEVRHVLNLSQAFDFHCYFNSFPRQSHIFLLHNSDQQHTSTTAQTTSESRWTGRLFTPFAFHWSPTSISDKTNDYYVSCEEETCMTLKV